MMAKVRAFMDRYVEKFISRKFLAWVTASGLCYHGFVSSEDWVAVTLAYVGSEALIDAAVAWRHGHKDSD